MVSQVIQRLGEGNTHNSILSNLKSETLEIVSLEKGLRIVDATGKIGNINASKRVNCSSVSTKLEGFWVCKISQCDIPYNLLPFVWICAWSSIPVVGNTFLPSLPNKGARLAGDSEK
jgi:hypothetical protein